MGLIKMNNDSILKEKEVVSEDKQKEFVNYILAKMAEVDKATKVFQATFSNYSKGYYKEGKKTEAIHEETITARMTFEKPLKVFLDVIDSPKDIAIGSKLLYTGGDNVKVRAAGILGLIPVSFSINDPMFSDTRNHKILATVDGLKRIIKDDTKAEIIGMSEINGREVYLIKIDAKEKLDPQITHEIMGVDSQTFVVLLNEMYVNDELVSQYKVTDIKTNIELEDDFFHL